jgi:hypothetical protein
MQQGHQGARAGVIRTAQEQAAGPAQVAQELLVIVTAEFRTGVTQKAEPPHKGHSATGRFFSALDMKRNNIS